MHVVIYIFYTTLDYCKGKLCVPHGNLLAALPVRLLGLREQRGDEVGEPRGGDMGEDGGGKGDEESNSVERVVVS